MNRLDSTSEQSRRKGPSLAARRGMITFSYLIICVLCTLMAIFLVNCSALMHRKQQLQNSADAASISASTWLARGLNALTATNHVIGDLTSLVIVHESIGGKTLDEGKTGDSRQEDASLTLAWGGAKVVGVSTPAYDTVREQRGVKAGKTILDAKKTLKRRLTICYGIKATARATGNYTIEALMHILELKILQEYKFLNLFEKAARVLIPVKVLVRDVILPRLKAHTDHIVRRYPELAEQAARETGKFHSVEIALFPRKLELPVQRDPHRYAQGPLNLPKLPPRQPPPPNPSRKPATNMREQVVKTSQLARATFPFVTYHRQPIIDLLKRLATLSEAADFYKDWTDGTSKELLDEFQQRSGLDLGLYVLKGSTAPDKGYELWTEDRNLADQLFAVQSFAYRPAPSVVGGGLFFNQMYPEGGFAHAQALIYNGNPQKRHPFHIPLQYKRIVDERQADAGWDTLNWKPGSRPNELVAKSRFGVKTSYPEVQINWQTKLVPVNPDLLSRALPQLPSAFAPVAPRVQGNLPSLQTH